ncbi:hypothetical protein N7532_000210 [Penicillium argentinense]|uniref:Protein kinase domain-containing protein n=1 Tax=Penicillium argentinense TaxID=1131581 RepID=A0A9W9G4U3_9EURO|nr:uncharacterized protein N7532_000210 [Penicillium argentinense]KAJ5112165.1 hypothetical protein N7532_000210 [Penicillium argentinense]
MEETIAQLRRQLDEERQAREAEAKAREEAEHREEEAKQAREAETKARVEAEQRLQPNTLFSLLDRCHRSLSQAIRVESNAALTTQGDATDPVNRLYPKRIVPWLDFPQFQEQIWQKFDRMAAFTSHPLFLSDTQIDVFVQRIQNWPIYSEASLRNFERDTVDYFVEMVIEALRDNGHLRHEFGIRGRVAFYDRVSPSKSSQENSIEQMNLQDMRTPQHPVNTRYGSGRGRRRQKRTSTARRRNRRADQFCVHLITNDQYIPAYAVEFKAPHKLTIPELVAGLHQMDLARDVINKDGDTFEFYTTRLVAAVVTQIFSYMIVSGIRYGYICTGEAFVFLHIPKDDPTIVQYFLSIPNQDVQADDKWCLHRTAIGQVLAFTLQALVAEGPSQEWHDTAHNNLSTWEVEYLDVLREIPETLRKDPPASNYRPSRWKQDLKIHNTRSRAHCQPSTSTPKPSLTEGSSSEEGSSSPSIAAVSSSRSSRSQGNIHQSTRGSKRKQAGRDNKQTSRKDRQSTRPYCTISCIRGIVNRDPLDMKCPNWKFHGHQGHSIGPQEFTRQLHHQITQDRNLGFEQLHICGRTGYLIKATLLSHGYTVIIKATTVEKQHRLQVEVENYQRLRSLQGRQIPVYLGEFKPRIAYWYHGKLMAQMMILSYSGMRLQHTVNDRNSIFLRQEREKALAVLRSHGVVHNDSEWRNMLWDDLSRQLVVIDLEDVKWLKGRQFLKPISGVRNTSVLGEQANTLV